MTTQDKTRENAPRDLITTAEAARITGYSCAYSFLRAARRYGYPTIKLNPRTIRVSRSALESFLNARSTGEGAAK